VEISEVRRRLRAAIEKARRESAERRARTDAAARDYETFAALLNGLGTRKVLVHCQINLRASSFVFLYRVLALGDAPRQAYEALSSVWVPHGPWRRLIETELRDHHIDFELL